MMRPPFRSFSRRAALAAACLVAGLAHGATFTVNVATDDGSGSVANTLSWTILQANASAGPDTISLQTDVQFTGPMFAMIDGDVTIEPDAGRRTLDGNGLTRPLFVLSGEVLIERLDVINGLAKGGDTNNGGGGAGMGGGLFVAGGTVTVREVSFISNRAVGGNGGSTGTGAGAGLWGDGSGFSGGGGLCASTSGDDGAYGCDASYGGAGGVFDGGAGGFGGGGAASAFGIGGAGGFGGGGGSGGDGGGGGFGGGGGSGYGSLYGDDGVGGAGGFGGGGGYGLFESGQGGFGGGGGDDGGGGGGGAGMGGAVFAMNGRLDLIDVAFSGNSATAGTGGGALAQALGGDLFVCSEDLDPGAADCDAHVFIGGRPAPQSVFGSYQSLSSGHDGDVIAIPLGGLAPAMALLILLSGLGGRMIAQTRRLPTASM